MNWGDIIVTGIIPKDSNSKRYYCPCIIEKYEHDNGETPESSYKVYLTPVGETADLFYKRAYYANDIFYKNDVIRKFDDITEAQMYADKCNGIVKETKEKKRNLTKFIILHLLRTTIIPFLLGLAIGKLIFM